MIAPARILKSSALLKCPASGQPVEFLKLVFFMPRRLASRFIAPAKASSEPAINSASATQASLPDCTIMPRNNSATVTGFFGSMNMREPPIFQARSDTGTVCSSVMVRALRAAKAR